MMGNWDDLRLFLAVAREQSLSGAGKLLRLDPATLGRRMARLEKAMQAVLFVKSPSGYALTEAGTQLLARAEAAEQAMRQATADVAVPSDQLAGQIRIGAPDGCANYLLPQVCARLVAENPARYPDRRLAACVQPVAARGRYGDRSQRADGGQARGSENCRLPTASCRC